MFINTVDEYMAYRETAVPIIVSGKGKRQVLVPCANTILAARPLVIANTYNPNHVSDDKMELLY